MNYTIESAIRRLGDARESFVDALLMYGKELIEGRSKIEAIELEDNTFSMAFVKTQTSAAEILALDTIIYEVKKQYKALTGEEFPKFSIEKPSITMAQAWDDSTSDGDDNGPL